MNSNASFAQLKAQIRERLRATPVSLELDPRIDEAPEDLIASIAARGRRDDVVRAIDELILEHLKQEPKAREQTEPAIRFLSSALRLCDSLQAERFKTTLKMILLDDNKKVWGEFLAELKELAARALLGLTKSKSDFRFWANIAEQWESSLPYALNAALEIDLYEGMALFWRMYLKTAPELKSEHPLVNWAAIIEEAEERFGEASVGTALESTFYDVVGSKKVVEFEIIVQRCLNLPRFSRLATRSLGEIAIDYTLRREEGPAILATAREPVSLNFLLSQHGRPVGAKPLSQHGSLISATESAIDPLLARLYKPVIDQFDSLTYQPKGHHGKKT